MKEFVPSATASAHEPLPQKLDLVDPARVAELAPALLAFIDTDRRYRYVNRAYESFYNRSSAVIVGSTTMDVTGPDHSAVAEQYVRRALQGEPASFAAPLRRADGAMRDVEVSYTPHRDDAGKVTGYISVTLDVTDWTFMSEARARLVAIVDSSDDAIVSKTLDGVITSWNRSAERIFGYTAAEAVGQHITLIIPAERRWEEDQVLARLRRGEKVDHFETERITKDGRIINISISVSPVRNAEGLIVGAAKVARDITDRKRSEAALRDMEEYRRAVFESMPECVKVLDRNGVVLDMNRSGLRMLEASGPENVVGKCVYPLINEADREAFRKLNEGVFDGEPGGRLEFCIRGFGGSERIFETNVVPLRAAAERVIGALSVTRDVTDRKQAEHRNAFLVRLDDETRGLSDPKEITATAARLLAEHLGVERCAYAEVDRDAVTFQITGDYTRGVPSIVGSHSIEAFGPVFRERMLAGKPFVIDDVEKDLVQPELAPTYLALDIRAVAAVPLLKSGRLVAGLAVHQTTPRAWRRDEVDLVGIVANRCWESIERARVEKELRDSERQFRTLADAMPNLAWMAHPDGHIFWYNHRWYEYTGTAPEDMEGWGWQRVHRPDVLPSVVSGWKHSIATGERFEMVFPLRGADGSFREFLTRVEPVRDERGRIARWFGTNTDVTVQQEAERREKRARETAEALNRVGPVLTAELDPERLTQKITDIATEAVRAAFGAFFHNVRNEAGESFLLYTLSGVDRDAFSRFPMPRNTHVFGPTFRGEGVVRSDDITKDPRYGHNPPYHGMPEGHIPVRSYLAVPVISRSGQVIGGLFFGHPEPGVFTPDAEAVATGIAAQAAIALDNASLFEQTRRASEALRKSNEELMRLNEDLNQFAYSASHDLREPLRMVSIYTQLLNRRIGPKLDDESVKYIEEVLRGSTRLEALIRDLLAYTKAAELEDDQVPVIDAGDAFRKALANLAATIEEAGARVSSASDMPQVRMAEVHFTQLLQNLIGNAIKYRSAAVPEIRIEATRNDGLWEFSVADNGIGIESDFKEQIFGIFKRLHNADKYSGTGIGLAICQRIVQRYGGRIWVESEPGRGSTFFFTVPAAD